MNTDFESKHARNTDGTFRNMHKAGQSSGIEIGMGGDRQARLAAAKAGRT